MDHTAYDTDRQASADAESARGGPPDHGDGHEDGDTIPDWLADAEAPPGEHDSVATADGDTQLADGDGHEDGDGRADPVHAGNAPSARRVVVAAPPEPNNGEPGPDFDHEAARVFLQRHIDPRLGCAEICVLKGSIDPRSGRVSKHPVYKGTISCWGDDPERLLRELGRVRGASAYVTVNAVRRDLMARTQRFDKVEWRTSAEDVTYLRFLYLDFDVVRPKGISSKAGELEACRECLQRVLDEHPELIDSSAWGTSGNGYWLIIRLPDYPNDEPHCGLIGRVVDWFCRTYSIAAVELDPSVKDANQLMPLPGLPKCKGENVRARPHRMVCELSPTGRDLVPLDLEAWAAEHGVPDEPTGADEPTEADEPTTLRIVRGPAAESPAPIQPAHTDDDVLAAAAGSDGFDALWAGDVGDHKSRSEAHLALGNRLAFFCGPGQVAQAARLFLRSTFGVRDTDKTDRDDYIALTVAKAYEGRGPDDYYRWPAPAEPSNNGHAGTAADSSRRFRPGDRVVCSDRNPPNIGDVVAVLRGGYRVHWVSPSGREDTGFVREGLCSAPGGSATSAGPVDWSKLSDEDLGMRRASKVKKKPIRFLLPGRIPEGDYTLIAGRGKQGKSLFTMAVAAKVSAGGEWWDGSGTAPLGHVFVLAAEDDAERVIAPRLEALGADSGRITILEAKYKVRPDDGGPQLVSFTSLQDLTYWREIFTRVKKRDTPLLMIIDPLPSYVGKGVNDRRNNDVRAILGPFIDLVKEFGMTLVGVTHFGKAGDARTAADKILDSVAYANLARAIIYVAVDPDDDDRRLVMPGDCSYSRRSQAALAFRIVERTIPPDDDCGADDDCREITIAVPEFEPGTVEADPDDIVTRAPTGKGGGRGRPASEAPKLAQWLAGFLKDKGPVLLGEIADAAGQAGLLGELSGTTRRDATSGPSSPRSGGRRRSCPTCRPRSTAGRS
jgi:hypothetical protein